MDTDARKDALAFLKRNKTGVLATLSPRNEPHASMIYYEADDDFNIFFLTLTTSRKFSALQANPQVAFVISSSDTPQTLQLEGVAMDISLDEEANKRKDELFSVLNSNPWYYAPISKLDPAESAIIWIRPTWVRWADYAFAPQGSEHVFKDIPVK